MVVPRLRAVKRDTLAGLLVGLLSASALVAAWLSVRWFLTVREMQELQVQFAVVNNARAAAQALSNDALTYARKNPAIEPILQEFNLRPPGVATNQAPARPAGK